MNAQAVHFHLEYDSPQGSASCQMMVQDVSCAQSVHHSTYGFRALVQEKIGHELLCKLCVGNDPHVCPERQRQYIDLQRRETLRAAKRKEVARTVFGIQSACPCVRFSARVSACYAVW